MLVQELQVDSAAACRWLKECLTKGCQAGGDDPKTDTVLSGLCPLKKSSIKNKSSSFINVCLETRISADTVQEVLLEGIVTKVIGTKIFNIIRQNG